MGKCNVAKIKRDFIKMESERLAAYLEKTRNNYKHRIAYCIGDFRTAMEHNGWRYTKAGVKIDVITKYQGKVITEYLHFYYPNQQLHNVTKFVSGGLIDSSITYYQSGGKRSIITYFPAKTVKTKIIYNEDGSVLSQVIYNEKGVVTSELNSNAANTHPDDFDILKQAIEYKGGNTALYQYIGAEIQ